MKLSYSQKFNAMIKVMISNLDYYFLMIHLHKATGMRLYQHFRFFNLILNQQLSIFIFQFLNISTYSMIPFFNDDLFLFNGLKQLLGFLFSIVRNFGFRNSCLHFNVLVGNYLRNPFNLLKKIYRLFYYPDLKHKEFQLNSDDVLQPQILRSDFLFQFLSYHHLSSSLAGTRLIQV